LPLAGTGGRPWEFPGSSTKVLGGAEPGAFDVPCVPCKVIGLDQSQRQRSWKKKWKRSSKALMQTAGSVEKWEHFKIEHFNESLNLHEIT